MAHESLDTSCEYNFPSMSFVTLNALSRSLKFDATISHLSSKGLGTVLIKSLADNRVFKFESPLTLPGDTVTLKISDVTHTLIPGRRKPIREPKFELLTINEPSEQRKTPICSHFGAGCTGCKFLDFASLSNEKEKLVSSKLRKPQYLEALKFFPPSSFVLEETRNFARLTFQRSSDGVLKYSYKNSVISHPISNCPLLTSGINLTLSDLSNAISDFDVYDPRRGSGFLKEVAINYQNNEYLVCLVVTPIPDSVKAIELVIKNSQQNPTPSDDPIKYSVVISSQDLLESENCNDLPVAVLDHPSLSPDIYTTLLSILNQPSKDSNLLVINAHPRSPLSDPTFFNVPSNRIDFISHSDTVDLINGDPNDFIDLNTSYSTVLVAGKLSKKLRSSLDDNPDIKQVVYFTQEINKIVWDADHYQKLHVNKIQVFDINLTGMDIWCIAEFIR
jgi:hypothetical protein